jgi:hypothetical protein
MPPPNIRWVLVGSLVLVLVIVMARSKRSWIPTSELKTNAHFTHPERAERPIEGRPER